MGPLGRVAVSASGEHAKAGEVVDGSVVRYQRFAPATPLLPRYFSPQAFSPAEIDGNRIVLAAFRDRYTEGYSEVDMQYALRDTTGATVVDSTQLVFSGVHLTSL
jgi:hypothetical protein